MDKSATKLQAAQRGKYQRSQRKKEVESARLMQSLHRGHRDRQAFKMKKSEWTSAITLQSRLRGAADRARASQKQRARSMEPIGDGLIHIGDVVKAKVRGEILFAEGVVIGKSGSGGVDEYDVDFGDGDIQEHVPRANIMKVHHWTLLEIGDKVKAPVPGMKSLLCEAVVTAYVGANPLKQPIYAVSFEDGEEANILGCDLTKVSSSRTKAVQQWHKGTNAISAVNAFADKKWGVYRRLSVSQITPIVKS